MIAEHRIRIIKRGYECEKCKVRWTNKEFYKEYIYGNEEKNIDKGFRTNARYNLEQSHCELSDEEWKLSELLR